MTRIFHTAAGGTRRAPLFPGGLVVLAIGAGWGFGMRPEGKIAPANSTENVMSATVVKDLNNAASNVGNISSTPVNERVHDERGTANAGFVVPSSVTIVNLEGPGFVRYVMAKYNLVAQTEDARRELVANGELVRDRVSVLMRRKGYEALRKPGNLSKDALRIEMKTAINEAHDQPLVKRVNITQFTIQ